MIWIRRLLITLLGVLLDFILLLAGVTVYFNVVDYKRTAVWIADKLFDSELIIGYLNVGNQNIDSTGVAEAYYRFVIGERFALTADLHYMLDGRQVGRNPEGYILGLCADVHF